MQINDDLKICVVGLGYVGLPLAVEFGRLFQVVGYDINSNRVDELRSGIDKTKEVQAHELSDAVYLTFTTELSEIIDASIYIITVPTPVDRFQRPDLAPLISATEAVAKVLKKGDIVIYESTVFPGATEEVCVPILTNISALQFNVDFYCGYSPERINPGDKEHRLTNIKKVTSGSTESIADFIDDLYNKIITAGTHKASCIKVAEAAKVIENTQRDLNIALVNELSLIFHKLNIDTIEVLEAAGTKWNFLPFRPGLVGGHCIGVDPYYLTHKASEVGYHPEVILAGRRINDGMPKHVVNEVIKLLINKGSNVSDCSILILGLAFKENCPDLRNSKVVDIIRELQSYRLKVDVYDPIISKEDADDEYGIKCLEVLKNDHKYEAIIVAVAHDEFIELGIQGIRLLCVPDAVVFDVKGAFPADRVDGRL